MKTFAAYFAVVEFHLLVFCFTGPHVVLQHVFSTPYIFFTVWAGKFGSFSMLFGHVLYHSRVSEF